MHGGEMPEITVQGQVVQIQDSVKASRRGIVFLHGAGGSHHTFRDQWAGLKGVVRLVIPDLPGPGARLRISPVIFEGIGGRFPEFAPELVGWMTSAASSDLLREDITNDVLSTRPATFLADFHACNGFDVMNRLGAIRVPTLVVNGDDDRLTPLKYGEYLAANIPGAVLKIIHGAGHLAMLEKPTEVNAVITSFVHSLEG